MVQLEKISDIIKDPYDFFVRCVNLYYDFIRDFDVMAVVVSDLASTVAGKIIIRHHENVVVDALKIWVYPDKIQMGSRFGSIKEFPITEVLPELEQTQEVKQ